MDSGNSEGGSGPEDKLRVDLLADRFEMYQIMALVFFQRLTKEEKVDALLEVVSLLKGTRDEQ